MCVKRGDRQEATVQRNSKMIFEKAWREKQETAPKYRPHIAPANWRMSSIFLSRPECLEELAFQTP